MQTRMILGLVLVGLIILAVSCSTVDEKERAAQAPAVKDEVHGMKTLGTTATGDVEISLQPTRDPDGKLRVALSANTHSIDLSAIDLQESVTLVHNGRRLPPISAPALSGHHARGDILFEEGIDAPFTILIRNVPAIDERVYSWE